MPVAVPKIRVGEPVRHQSLSVFPLFTESNGGVDYRLSDEALADESLIVEEVSESGSVPELLVENKGDTLVLFIEGEELIGAKQNRILNTSVLIAAKSKVKIPVSCVEQGRWGYRSRRFKSSGSHSPSSLRYALKRSVSGSARTGRGHRSDQGEVWTHVDACLSTHAVASSTSAMSEAFEALEDRTSDYRNELKYVEGATGVAVAIGRQVVAVDVFDKPSTCQKVWDRLISGCILDALQAESQQDEADATDVERLVSSAEEANWQQVRPVGEGEEYRAEFAEDHASALSFEDSLVHASVVAAS
jgi:hypothetical protein